MFSCLLFTVLFTIISIISSTILKLHIWLVLFLDKIRLHKFIGGYPFFYFLLCRYVEVEPLRIKTNVFSKKTNKQTNKKNQQQKNKNKNKTNNNQKKKKTPTKNNNNNKTNKQATKKKKKKKKKETNRKAGTQNKENYNIARGYMGYRWRNVVSDCRK